MADLDSSVLEESWKDYELWEKIRARKRKKKIWILGGTFLAFCLLASIPVITDRLPKWKTLRLAREGALRIQEMKRRSLEIKNPIRIQFVQQAENIEWEWLKVVSCEAEGGDSLQKGVLVPEGTGSADQILVESQEANRLEVDGFVRTFCFDPIKGNEYWTKGKERNAVGFIPKADITLGRADRLSLVIFEGPNAAIHFE